MKLRNVITVSDLMQKCTSMFNTVADSIRKSDSENRSIRQTAFSFPTGQDKLHLISGKTHMEVCRFHRFDRFVRMDNFADNPTKEFIDQT